MYNQGNQVAEGLRRDTMSRGKVLVVDDEHVVTEVLEQ